MSSRNLHDVGQKRGQKRGQDGQDGRGGLDSSGAADRDLDMLIGRSQPGFAAYQRPSNRIYLSLLVAECGRRQLTLPFWFLGHS